MQQAMDRGLQAIIIRPPAILGAHPTSTWCTKIARAIAAGQLKLFGDGGNTFSSVDVENLVYAMLLAFTQEVVVGQAYYNAIYGHLT